jgi:hypothetical protein
MEPGRATSSEPVIDELTKKMTAAFRRGKSGPRWRGWHTCACGAKSDNTDYALPNGEETNSLCVHYLAYHRAEVSQSQLEKVAALDSGEADPSEKELAPPR